MPAESGALGIVVECDVDVVMRDGVVLRANVFRPDAHGAFPGLLLRTPYGKPNSGYERFVRAGYAVVAQDVRGRHASDGEFTVLTVESEQEAEDGYDTVEWLAARSWCNGRVGAMGASYLGWLQWKLAALRPPHLRAMSACSIPLELTDLDWPGAFRPARRMRWWLTNIAPDLRKRAGMPPPHTKEEADLIWSNLEHGRWLGLLPWSQVARRLPPPLDTQVENWLRRPNVRPWKFAQSHAEIEVPNLDFTGWYDHCSSIGHLSGMQKNARTELARAQTRVVIGPWAHNTVGQRACLGIDFGPQAAVDKEAMIIRWFDHWLKGLANGVEREPAVRYFVMGAAQWKSASTWPPEGLRENTLHLASAGDAAEGCGSLAPAPGSQAPSDAYLYDPVDPVPTLWSRDLFAGASDRRKLDYRQDILVYRTSPLEDELEVVGHAHVVLHAASTAPDTDFFARLVDDQPGGHALEVAYGMVRARHRNSLDREEFITPGEVVQYRIALGPTACRFRRGHRIRLEITSSDFPNFDRNHNTGRNDLDDAELACATQTVFHSPEYPSRLVLPVQQ